MNIAKEVRALIAAEQQYLGQRPCNFRLICHKEGESLTRHEMDRAQEENMPILIKKHDGSFVIYGKLPGKSWYENPLKSLSASEATALAELKFETGLLSFGMDSFLDADLISALQKGHAESRYDKYINNMFYNLVYEGLPELKEGVMYYPIYALYATAADIPAEKKPGHIYFYVEGDQLHYQTQWIMEDAGHEAQPDILTGTIHRSAEEIRLLKDVEFVDNPVKPGDPGRTVWYDFSGERCIYSLIDDNGKKRVGSINITPKCNLSLLAIGAGDSLSEESMRYAQKEKTPILIKKDHTFIIYGQVDGGWKEIALESLSVDEIAILNTLDFNKPLLQGDEITDKLAHILKKGHAEAGDTHESIREKLWEKIQGEKYCLDKKEHFIRLEQNIKDTVTRANHMQPFYEVREALPHWYKEIRETIEENFLRSAKELCEILSQENFKQCFQNDSERELIGKLTKVFEKIILNQLHIDACLQEYENPYQLIDCLKKAYGEKFNIEIYSQMATLIFKFDLLLKEPHIAKNIANLFPGADGKNEVTTVSFIVNSNLTARFVTQYVLRRQLLLQSLADYFKKGQKKFYELTPIYCAVNKSAVAANRAKDGFLEDAVRKAEEGMNRSGLTALMREIANEKNPCKKFTLDLILPIWTLLILDTQSDMEDGRREDKTATFYMQRKILITQLEKFKKEWELSDEANEGIDSAIRKISKTGCKFALMSDIAAQEPLELDKLYLRLEEEKIIYKIRLKEGEEINGFIESKDLNDVDIPKELNLSDDCFMANILCAIAKQKNLPPLCNQDMVELLNAVTMVIHILSPENCKLKEKDDKPRMGRLTSRPEPRPASVLAPNPQRNEPSTFFGFFRKPVWSKGKDSRLSTELQSENPSAWSHSSPEEDELCVSPADSPDATSERVYFFSTILNEEEKSKVQEELRALLRKKGPIKKKEVELMEQLAVAGDVFGLFLLAQAVERGDGGLKKDPVAAYYLAKLAFERVQDGSGKQKISNFLAKLHCPKTNATCDLKLEADGQVLDPKAFYEIYLSQRAQEGLGACSEGLGF